MLCCCNLSLMKILEVLEKFGLDVVDESISRTQWLKGKCVTVQNHFSQGYLRCRERDMLLF